MSGPSRWASRMDKKEWNIPLVWLILIGFLCFESGWRRARQRADYMHWTITTHAIMLILMCTCCHTNQYMREHIWKHSTIASMSKQITHDAGTRWGLIWTGTNGHCHMFPARWHVQLHNIWYANMCVRPLGQYPEHYNIIWLQCI